VKSRNAKLAITLILGFLSQCVLLGKALAQTDQELLTSEQQLEVIEAFSEALLEHYVLPEKAAVLVDALQQAQARNDDASSKTMSEFLDQTNDFIQTTANDKHLRLLSPEKFNQMMTMFHGDDPEHSQQQSEEHPQPESANHGGGHGVSGHAPAGHSTSNNPLSVVGVSNVSEISRDGLNQTGYLALERFDGSARAVAFIERVFSTFTESDNIVIDLRNCGGGDAEMVKALSSYFFDEPTHLLNTVMPGEGNNARTVVERWTAPNKLSQYFAQKPLKILISSKTFSAAESFSFGMQAAGRAELVGETTGGGGYINDFFPLPYGLGASISVGRTYDPVTGRGWQGIGVSPEVQIEQDHALITALTSFTEQSGKLDKLQGEELQIYHQIQKYTNAWYGADHKSMRDLISDDFIGVYSDQSGAEVERVSFEQLISNTKNGAGQRDNKIYYNRIIRGIDVNSGQASVTLILRETIHHMSLKKEGDKWLISHDDFKDKQRGPAR
jgi:hypothetical protein